MLLWVTGKMEGAEAATSYNARNAQDETDPLRMSATHRLLRFGMYELNLDTEELRATGTPLKLQPQPFRLLALLASHSGQVVTRDEIKQILWGDETYVDFEHGMNKCIKQIRTVLSDRHQRPVYIETIPRHGYRFLAPVTAKTVLAPPARVKESSSGIPPDLAEIIRARVAARKAAAAEAAKPDTEIVLGGTAEPLLPASLDEPASYRWIWIGLGSVAVLVLVALVIYWGMRK